MISRSEIIERFASELTRVVGAVRDAEVERKPATARNEPGFVLVIRAEEADCGELIVAIGRRGGEALAKAIHPHTGPRSESDVVETLKGLCRQALAGFDPGELGDITLSISRVAVVHELPDPAAGMAMEIVLKGHDHGVYVALLGTLALTGDPAHPSPSKTLDVIMDLDLPLVVRFGRTELPLKALTSLGPGSVIDLGRGPDDPVDVLISNRVVARGEVVIVGGNYGVRVRDVVSPAERARSLEAELA